MEQIQSFLKDPEKIARYFQKVPGKKIRRLTFFNEDEFGSGINIYLMSKKSFDHAPEALCAGWLMQYLWEEDLDEFRYDMDSCMEAATFFLEETARYKYEKLDECETKTYISKKLNPIMDISSKIQQKEKHPEKVGFLAKSGIYVDQKYTTEKSFLFRKDEIVSESVLLIEEQGAQPYREIFFETDIKYVLFLE